MRTRWWLLVDDDDVDRTHVERRLQRLGGGVALEWTADGLGALDVLRACLHANRCPPEVILLDLELPTCTGLDVLERLKRDPEVRGFPVVMRSSSDRGSDVARAFAAGAVGYFVKGSSPDEEDGQIEAIAQYWQRSRHAGPGCAACGRCYDAETEGGDDAAAW